MMKKFLSVVLCLVLAVSAFAGFGQGKGMAESGASPVTVRLGGLKGPTTMGMVKLLDDAENGFTENNYEFTMAASADELTPKFLKGELDILAVPANLGSVLYNNSNGAVRALAVNTLGVIYIVEKGGNEIQSLADLKGQTIYATGKGTTPEYALNYLLGQNGLDPESDVTVEWKNEPTEVVAKMATLDHAVAMMPQPFVTVASGQLEDFRIAVDMTEAWDALDNGSRFITAALIVRDAFAQENPEAVRTFLEEYAASTDYANSNPQEAGMLVEKYDIVKAPVAEKAIPFCNMVCITGNEMKSSLEGYLAILAEQNPKAVGGKLPAEDYYLIYD